MIRFLSENKAALAVLVLAVFFVGIGISRGEMGTVMLKAVNICLECIGIG